MRWRFFAAGIGIRFTLTSGGRGARLTDAEDLTQEFFARLLEKEWLLAASPEKADSALFS